MRGLVLLAVLAASRVHATTNLFVPTDEDTSVYGDCKSANVLSCVKVNVTFSLLELGASTVQFPDHRIMNRATNVQSAAYFTVQLKTNN